MTAALTGVWNTNPAQVADVLRSNGASAGANDSSSGNSATIAANDFLTLLVTEMKNQDPTAATDPNQYVNQLVQVNSLQQLISINETLQSEAPNFHSKHPVPGMETASADTASRTSAGSIAGRNTEAAGSSLATGLRTISSGYPEATRIAPALTR